MLKNEVTQPILVQGFFIGSKLTPPTQLFPGIFLYP